MSSGQQEIPGDYNSLAGFSRTLREASQQLSGLQARLNQGGLEGWIGQGADRFRTALEPFQPHLSTIAAAFESAADSVGQYAENLTQHQSAYRAVSGQIASKTAHKESLLGSVEHWAEKEVQDAEHAIASLVSEAERIWSEWERDVVHCATVVADEVAHLAVAGYRDVAQAFTIVAGVELHAIEDAVRVAEKVGSDVYDTAAAAVDWVHDHWHTIEDVLGWVGLGVGIAAFVAAQFIPGVDLLADTAAVGDFADAANGLMDISDLSRLDELGNLSKLGKAVLYLNRANTGLTVEGTADNFVGYATGDENATQFVTGLAGTELGLGGAIPGEGKATQWVLNGASWVASVVPLVPGSGNAPTTAAVSPPSSLSRAGGPIIWPVSDGPTPVLVSGLQPAVGL